MWFSRGAALHGLGGNSHAPTSAGLALILAGSLLQKRGG